MVTILSNFLAWTLILYWIHRIVHVVPVLRNIHMDHHLQVTQGNVGWSLNNFVLFNDTWMSTLDLWITEVAPTLVFCWVFDCWWIAALYYVWAALIQEEIEHDFEFDVPVLTSGKWHMVHHTYWMQNYSVFIPIWDLVFGTYASPSRKI